MPCRSFSCSCAAGLAAILRVDAQLLDQLGVLGLVLALRPIRGHHGGKEVLELGEVVLCPLVERMLVALCTLNAHAHERVGNPDRPCLE